MTGWIEDTSRKSASHPKKKTEIYRDRKHPEQRLPGRAFGDEWEAVESFTPNMALVIGRICRIIIKAVLIL